MYPCSVLPQISESVTNHCNRLSSTLVNMWKLLIFSEIKTSNGEHKRQIQINLFSFRCNTVGIDLTLQRLYHILHTSAIHCFCFPKNEYSRNVQDIQIEDTRDAPICITKILLYIIPALIS
eukprot:NODE_365_length_10088_cov_0.583041.p3 type:complete len:121 gc:universal NODE_365_length_10088_cov_0.583041:2574-2936(+)